MKAFKAWILLLDDKRMLTINLLRSSVRADRVRYSHSAATAQRLREVHVEVRPLPKKKPAAKRAIPKPGRKMSHAEAQDHADKRYGKAFRKLAQTDTKRKGK